MSGAHGGMDERHLGRGLTALRRERRLALQDVALRTGLPVAEIVKYEQGEGGWGVERLLQVLDSLGATLQELHIAAESGRCLSLRERLLRSARELERLSEEAAQARPIGGLGS